MVCFPNAKINIGLTVKGKRVDGFHNLETVFYPIPFQEVLEVLENTETEDEFDLTVSGNAIEGSIENNLCYKAYILLKKDFPQLPNVRVLLHKNIPTGAGLGGGSANGAFMLQLLNDKFDLQIPHSQLLEYALALGSDCPFFILNQPCLAEGRGELLQPIKLNLSHFSIIIINPGIHIHTGTAFKELKPTPEKSNIQNAIQMPIEMWKEHIFNDFESGIFNKYPTIEKIKHQLYKEGALFASMTGTGSSVFGIFNEKKQIDFSENYFLKWV